MKLCIALALVVAGSFVSQAVAGQKFMATWWNGVVYRTDHFEPSIPVTGPPSLISRTTWKSEKSPKGTIIHIGKGYLTADGKGRVFVSPKRTPGSYWVMREDKTQKGRYNASDDWRGTWSRTTYTLEAIAPGLPTRKLGFRDGKLTVHPENKGLAILSVTHIDAEEISGK